MQFFLNYSTAQSRLCQATQLYRTKIVYFKCGVTCRRIIAVTQDNVIAIKNIYLGCVNHIKPSLIIFIYKQKTCMINNRLQTWTIKTLSTK